MKVAYPEYTIGQVIFSQALGRQVWDGHKFVSQKEWEQAQATMKR